MRNHIKDLNIEQKYIAIFASGPSVWRMRDEDFRYISKRSYMVGLNESPLNIDARIWSDYRVTKKLEKYYKEHEKDCVFISRDYAFRVSIPSKIRINVDYWFEKEDTAERNYTLLTTIEVLKKYFPDKIQLIFGLDCNTHDIRRKTLDENNNIVIKEQPIYEHNLEETKKLFEEKEHRFYHNIWNCNLNSKVNIPKKHYMEIL